MSELDASGTEYMSDVQARSSGTADGGKPACMPGPSPRTEILHLVPRPVFTSTLIPWSRVSVPTRSPVSGDRSWGGI